MKEVSPYRKIADSAADIAEKRLGFRRPFVIRVHHLNNMARRVEGDYRSQANNILTGVSNMDRPGYARDVLGETVDEAAQFQNSVEGFFEKFDGLDNNHPVKIVSGQKDAICNGCAVGIHCSTGREIKGDMLYMIDYFRSVVGTENLSDRVSFVTENVKSSDSGMFKTTSAITTAGVIRKVLEAWPNQSE